LTTASRSDQWRLGEVRGEPLGYRREAGSAGTGRDQRQRGNPIGVVERQVLRDPGTHGDSHDMRPGDAEGVEHPRGVPGKIRPTVVRRARLVGDRLARVAEVVPDHEPRAGGEALAELVLPPVHRAGQPADQQDRRALAITEGLDAELDSVGQDDPRLRDAQLSLRRHHAVVR
jgi:hypothetical protein